MVCRAGGRGGNLGRLFAHEHVRKKMPCNSTRSNSVSQTAPIFLGKIETREIFISAPTRHAGGQHLRLQRSSSTFWQGCQRRDARNGRPRAIEGRANFFIFARQFFHFAHLNHWPHEDLLYLTCTLAIGSPLERLGSPASLSPSLISSSLCAPGTKSPSDSDRNRKNGINHAHKTAPRSALLYIIGSSSPLFTG